MKTSSTTEDFVTKATIRHNGKYNYTKVDYRGAKSKVEIICPAHGVFNQIATNHLTGSGCPTCGDIASESAKRYTQDEFITTSTEKHSGKYSYEFVNYVDSVTPVSITCKVHGVFCQSPSNHIQGQGCRKCAKSGYNTGKPGHLYVLFDDDLVKVGVTNNSVPTRVKQINKASNRKFQIKFFIYFEDGKSALGIETLVLRELNTLYVRCSENFDGGSECFYNVDSDNLIKLIVKTYQSILDKET